MFATRSISELMSGSERSMFRQVAPERTFDDSVVTLAVGSLVVRASDSGPEGLGSMPDATKYTPSTHGVRAR
ncbi:hypothetical protein TNCV_2719811 [Trichonephila clavipes]|nr:hypothetical protein TNCV_2719811 [Trichonephila clavipes]